MRSTIMILPRLVIPLDAIEKWPSPNHVDPITRGNANLIINCILFPLVALLLGLRTYTRLYICKSFGLDDWLIGAAFFPATAFAVMTLMTELGLGWERHMWDVELSTFSVGLKSIIAILILFDAATSLTKLSMLTLTYRVIADGSKTMRWLIICTITLVSVEAVLFFFLVLFQCKPMNVYWTLTTTPQNCLSQPALLLAAGIINTFTDFLVVTLPLPIVCGLKLPAREHIVLMFLFGTGFIICAAGCVRTYYTYRVTVVDDKSWMTFPVWLSSDAELYLGIICASIPATKKFFSLYIPRLLGNKHSSFDDTKSIHSTPNTIEEHELDAVGSSLKCRWTRKREHKQLMSVQEVWNTGNNISETELCRQGGNHSKNSSSRDLNEMDGIARLESYDELVASANQSRKSQGAFG